MKKILSRAIMLALAFALCFGLSSCGLIRKCEHRDADDDFNCDICGRFYTDGKDDKVCQHRDADDNSFCDNCGAAFSDGKDITNATSCQHRDADDNARCDGCGIAFTDGKDITDAPECQHRDADDNSLCDNCGESYTDEKDIHYFGEWIKESESEDSCELDRFARTCSDCGAVEYKFAGFENHTFETEYSSDTSFHWYVCQRCDAVSGREEHEFDQTDYCSLCNALRAPTEGLIYELSSDGTYAEVVGYVGVAKKIIVADEYQDAPVKVIAESAFNDTAIAGITIPNSVTTIGDLAFAHCIELAFVKIGKNVSDIGKSVFYSCDALENIFVDEENETYKDIDGNLYTKDRKTLLQYSEGKKNASFDIPDGVETVAREAFLNAINLTSITVPNSVKEIGEYAFSNCAKLKVMKLGKGIVSISAYAFIWCAEIEAVYYAGTLDEWNSVEVDSLGNLVLKSELFYVYSENAPTSEGSFWHYVDSNPTPWPKELGTEAPEESGE